MAAINWYRKDGELSSVEDLRKTIDQYLNEYESKVIRESMERKG